MHSNFAPDMNLPLNTKHHAQHPQAFHIEKKCQNSAATGLSWYATLHVLLHNVGCRKLQMLMATLTCCCSAHSIVVVMRKTLSLSSTDMT
jgi:hypothetical protein